MIVIGEKLNATRKSVAAALRDRDEAFVQELVQAQEQAGAGVIDINAGTGKDAASAADDMLWLCRVARKVTQKPLALDSEEPGVLAAGLSLQSGPPAWINSVSAEKRRMEGVLPLAKRHGCPLVCLCMDDSGIPRDAASRMKAARAIYDAALATGIAPGSLFFDPLAMPLGADPHAGKLALSALASIKSEFPGAHTVVGLSNISFGLPQRPAVNASFLVLCAQAGLDAVICDPLDEPLMMGLLAAEALLGRDPWCARYIAGFRKRKKGETK
ncbi:MAG: dihydropteroate synthase [Thermodesulfobacteriota bacterium]